MIEYWVVSCVGSIWLRLVGKANRPGVRDLPGLCRVVGRGEPVTARTLLRAQGFAAGIWWRIGMGAVLLMLVIGVAAKAVSRQVPSAKVAVVAFLVCVMAVALVQTISIWFHVPQVRRHAQTKSPAAEKSLPKGSPGLSSRADFWVALAIAVVAFMILLFAGTRSLRHSG